MGMFDWIRDAKQEALNELALEEQQKKQKAEADKKLWDDYESADKYQIVKGYNLRKNHDVFAVKQKTIVCGFTAGFPYIEYVEVFVYDTKEEAEKAVAGLLDTDVKFTK